jgi:hypothetical protein
MIQLELFLGIALLADGLKYSYHAPANEHSAAIVSSPSCLEKGLALITIVIHHFHRRTYMHSRTLYRIFIVVFVFLLCQMCIAGQELHYKFEKGKTYHYSTVIESKTSGQSMGQEFTMTSGADFDYSISLLSVNAGVLTLTVKFEKFNIKINMPMMGFNDSTIVMREYAGKRIKVVMTDKGKTLSVVPIDTIPPSQIQMMAGLDPSDLFKQILLEFPEKEIDVKGSWKKINPDTLSRGGIKMVIKPNIEFKVAAEEKNTDYNCWKIGISGTSSIEGNGSQRGADVTLDGTVKINGSAFIAPAEGIFVLSEQSSDTDMTTTATGSQTGASTMRINTTVKTKLIK